jgi:hypothetical protein
MKTFKKSIVYTLAVLSLVFVLTLVWNWDSFKKGWDSYQCECPA